MTKSTRFVTHHKMPSSVSPTEKVMTDVWYTPATNESGCFTKGTTILKGNCEGIDISAVTPNTIYLGGGGNPGKVSDEHRKYTTDAARPVYGFNGQKPFFTADHPFATQHGWRALDPVAAKKISPWLDIGHLEVGDYVKRLSAKMGPRGFEYKLEKIFNITMESLPAGSVLYGLHTKEGPKSYNANGYLVHMHFAEILPNTLQKSIARLFKSEAESVVERVIKPLLSDMHGEQGQIYLEAIKNGLKNTHTVEKAHIPIEEVMLHDMELSYDMECHDLPINMSLIRGEVYINNEFIESGTILNEHQVVWTRDIGGILQHGCLHLNPDRRTGYGRISFTDYPPAPTIASFVQDYPPAPTAVSFVQDVSPKSDMLVPHGKFTAKLPDNVYNCKVGVTPLAEGETVSGGEMVDWGTLIMGYVYDPKAGKMRPSGQVTMPPVVSKPSFAKKVIFSVDKKTQALKVELTVPQDYYPFGIKYIQMQAVFSWDYSSLKGTTTDYDANATAYLGKTYEFEGQIVLSASAQARLQQSRNASVLRQKSYSSAVKPMLAMSSPVQYSVHPDALALADASRKEDLSLSELFTLTAPPQSEVHSLTFDLIKEMMTHQLDDNVRNNVLGVTKPDIGNLEDFAKKHKTFLVDEFGVGYIGYALSKNVRYKDSFSTDDKNAMLYYWAGDDKTSLSHNKNYNNTNTVVSTYAYVKENEKLQKYMNSDPAGWAEKLFHEFDSPYVMNGFIHSLDAANTNEILQKQCMVLQCLAPDKDYGPKLFYKVMVQRLADIGKTYTGSTSTIEILQEFIYDAFGQMITQILAGTDKLDKSIGDELRKNIQKSMEEVQATSTTDYMNSMQTMIANVISIWGKEPGVLMQRLSSAGAKMFKNSPKLEFTGKVFGSISSLAMYGFMAYNVVSMFMNWKNLSPDQKLLAVANAISFAFSSIGKIPSIMNKLQEIKKGFYDFDFVQDWLSATDSETTKLLEEEHMNKQVEDIENIPKEEVVTRVSEQATVAGGTAEAEEVTVTRFTKVFNVVDKLVKVFNIVALSAAVIAMGFQIARDFEEGQSPAIKVLDISEAAVFGLQIAVEISAMVFENAVLSTLGSALALVGIVIAIVLMIIGRKPPKPKPTAADNFVNNQVKPFVKKLPVPEKDWLDKYHNRSKK